VPFNSTAYDYAPSITADAKRMYFTSNRPGGFGMLDVWYTDKFDTTWGDPVNCGAPINDSLPNSMTAITPDGMTMVVTECSESDGYGSCDLYITHLQKDGTWSKPENMGPSINSSGWESNPCLSRDGNTLYFASDRSGGVGGLDIWMSKRTASGWSTPVDLVGVNTPGNDVSPYISLDDSTLYFGSNGIEANSTGYCDIYMSERHNGEWSKPVPVTPANSPYDDFFPTMSGSQDRMYFCSNRTDTTFKYRGYHIYEVPLPWEFRPAHAFTSVRGKVLDNETQIPLDAQIVIQDRKTSAVVYSGENNPLTGAFSFILPRDHDYRIFATVNDYYLANADFSLMDTSSELLTENVIAEHVQVGRPHIVAQVFQHGSDSLTPEGMLEVKKIAALMTDDQALRAAVFINNELVDDDSLLRERRIKRLRTALRDARRDVLNIDWKIQPFAGEALAPKNNYIVLVPILN
jgi:hypothetical protein